MASRTAIPPPAAAPAPAAREVPPIDQTPSPVGRPLIPDTSGVTNRQLFRWMFRFLRPIRGLVVMACVYLSLWVAAEVLTTRQAAEAVNHIKRMHVGALGEAAAAAQGFWAWVTSPQPDAAGLRRRVGVLLGLVVVYAAFRYLREVTNTKMSMNMVFYIREAVYDRLQRLGFAFHDVLSTGQLINRALTDLQNVRAFIQTAVLVSLEIVLVVIGNIILLLSRNPWVALLAVAPLPVWTYYVLRFSRKIQPAERAAMEAGDKQVNVLTENIAGVHVVKAFATEPYEIAKYGTSCDDFKAKVLKRIRMYADFQPVIRSIATASMLSLFLLAGVMMIRRRMEPGDLLILGGAMGAILNRLQQVGTINEQYQSAIVSARRLYEVLMAEPGVPESPKAQPLPAGPGAVRFEGVTFGYDPAKPVIRDVGFDVAGGSVVAVVGPTGAGKTTLVNLLARFYDPQQGRILIDGTDVRDATLASLRGQVASVFQETYLFSDTVAANIAYGRPGIARGDVEAAARLAQAHEFIENLPRGYDTVLAERGSSLSGGQKQRLAIARAILTNPRVLILDDATASIDPETEDLIRRAMNFVMRGRTTFVIAHRISTVKRADLVLVLENGRITQSGTHDQLMRAAGHYQEIAEAQLYPDGEAPAADDDEEVTEAGPSHMDRIRDEERARDEQPRPRAAG